MKRFANLLGKRGGKLCHVLSCERPRPRTDDCAKAMWKEKDEGESEKITFLSTLPKQTRHEELYASFHGSYAYSDLRLFCESGSVNNPGEEVLHLPVIVDAAESSPQAAAASAYEIRKFLSKENYARPHVQYNAIMLIRILADNPGPNFTRNMDGKFVTTTKELLKNGRDASVQQILRETLDALEADKAYDANLTLLFSMWRKEKGY
ncbi:hypothetical protein LTR28_012318, partial [Elasticomyces elasticus]